MVGTGAAARHGILIKDAQALEVAQAAFVCSWATTEQAVVSLIDDMVDLV